VDGDTSSYNNYVVWLKTVPLKTSIFTWRMLHNLLLTKDNLERWRIITTEAQNCSGNCGSLEDMDHLFMRCDSTITFGLYYPWRILISISWHFIISSFSILRFREFLETRSISFSY